MSNDKRTRLEELANERRAATPPKCYSSIGSFHEGKYDKPDKCPFVSPYTIGASNVDAHVFILLQDWASAKWLSGPFKQKIADLGRDPCLPTNKTLSKLLAAHLGLQLEETFATNLFPYVKPGNMKTPIPHDLLFASARRFAIPQIEVVKPSLVICLGLDTFNALSDALEQRTFGRIANAIESRIKLPTGQQIWCQAHTGKLGQMTRNRKGPGTVDQDWRAMTEDYRQSR